MTKEEFKALAKGMRAVYTNERFLPDDASMKMWYSLLQDIPYSVASIAVQKYMLTNKFPPTPAEIREQALAVQMGEKPLWSDAWGNVLAVIKKYGSYGQAQAMESLDEITRQAVQRIGYLDLCRSENIVADRANFRMIYEQLVDREQDANKIPISLQQLIESERGQIAGDGSKRLLDAGHKAGQADQ